MQRSLVDLGATPLANCYVTAEQAAQGADRPYPLHVLVCDRCLLVQVGETVPPEAIFAADYAYFSSFSAGWVAHAQRYAAAMTARFELDAQSLVAEVASNDGYLLQHFRAMDIPVLGIEPAAGVAAAARRIGVRTEQMFFGADTAAGLASRYGRADLIAANNVLAHVPDLPGFVAGFTAMLRPEGVATFEFPHLLSLLQHVQFDTIYHEHFSYLSLLVVEHVLRDAGLRAFDVECLPTHGGSLRVFACRADASHAHQPGLDAVRAQEAAAGLHRPEAYDSFAPKVARIQQDFRHFVAARTRTRPIARGLRRRRQGQHAAEFLRHHRARYRLRRRPQSGQAGQAAARQPYSRGLAGSAGRRAAGRRGHPAVEPRRRGRRGTRTAARRRHAAVGRRAGSARGLGACGSC